jgi:GNAT superfamily N-acetyltransferase
MQLVQLRPDHLRDLMELKAAAHWNQTEADWLRVLRLEPEGCFGFDVEGRIVASATLIRYGQRLAWIGMVLTLPEYRGRGLARRLMEHVIQLSRNTGAVRLDASDMGKALYASLGFVDECPIERWVREPGSVAGPSLTAANVDRVLDCKVFGADRSALVADLAHHESASSRSGYAFARPGSNYHFFGPCVAETQADARTLIEWFLGRHGDRPTSLDLFPHHEGAVALAREYGFAPVRHLTRMVLSPKPPALPDQRIYSAAGFEFG